jgi:hypothetical protein
MDLTLMFYGCLCATTTFTINGVEAHKEDFGEQYDRSPETAEDYCCGDMQFTRIPPTPEVLAKYKITEEEYAQVCDKLEEGLSFGRCGCCS